MHQDNVYKVRGYLLIPSFSLFFLPFVIIKLRYSSHPNYRSLYLRIIVRILYTKVSHGKIGNFHFPNNRERESDTTNSSQFRRYQHRHHFIQKRSVLCTQRKLNRRRNRRKGCLHVCGPILSSICMSLFTARASSDFSRRGSRIACTDERYRAAYFFAVQDSRVKLRSNL